MIMTPVERDRSRRVLACPRWRWLRGASSYFVVSGGAAVGDRFVYTDGAVVGHFLYSNDEGAGYQVEGWRVPGEELPDLEDPATKGTLLTLVREAWNDPSAHTEPHPNVGGWRADYGQPSVGGWRCTYGPYCSPVFPTEAEALVFALEQAPAKPVVLERTP
jgi:hypothetical protein